MRFFALAALAYVATAVTIEAEPTDIDNELVEMNEDEMAPADEVEEVEMPEAEPVSDEDDLVEVAAEDMNLPDGTERTFAEESVDENNQRKITYIKRRKVLVKYRKGSKRVRKMVGYRWKTYTKTKVYKKKVPKWRTVTVPVYGEHYVWRTYKKTRYV